MDTYIGQEIEQYKIESKIGSGSSGTVYRATDLNLVRSVVLKLLKPMLTKNPARQKQILKAAQAASRLSHPAIVPLYNFGQQNGHVYLVTALVEGMSLERLLALLNQGEHVLRLDESLYIVAQIADGLGYAHQAGVHHGDLKPGNILLKPLERPLRSSDPPLKAMLADFGLSPIPDSGIPEGLSAEQARPLHRYLPYLAPERQAGQPADGRADIYSLGIILHQLVSGQLPNHKQPLRDLCPGVPSNIIEIVEKATAYGLADRYQLAEKMADDLRLAASRLTAADTLLFAPQATVSDFATMLAASKESSPVQPATINLEQTAVPHQPQQDNQNSQNEEEATPVLQAATTNEPPHTVLQPSPPPAIGDQIIITGQGRAPRHFSMNKPKITIGRAPDNDIVLSSPDVSRQHARLEQQNNGWAIIDAKSRGGIFYNGRKLSPKQPESWQPDLRLQIGPYFLQWQLAEELANNPAPNTPAAPVTELFQISADGSHVQASNSSFSVALNPTQAALAPGGEAHLQIELFNQSSTILLVKISLTGLPDIATLAQDTVSIAPGGRATVPLTLQLPTVEQPLLAGQHPFQLLLQAGDSSVETAETAVLQGQLTILPEEQFELSIWPAHVENGGTCRVMVRNDGNVSSTLTLTTQDPAGKLQFFGDEQPMVLDAGGTATTAYRITHRKKRPFFGRVRQIPFEVEIRSSNGHLQNKLGHLELRPRFPAWVLPLIQLLLVLVLVAVVLNSVFDSRQNPVGNMPTTPVLGEGTAAVTTAPATLTAVQLAGDDDSDGLSGEQEIKIGSDPFNDDSDGDGLLDGIEINTYNTDPLLSDSDGDGLDDAEELDQYQTDPTLADTDLDGTSDGDEVAAGSDPLRFQDDGETAVVSTPSTSTSVPAVTAAPSDNETTVEIVMLPEQSGWLSSSGEVNIGSSNMPRAGDLADETAVRGLLTFPLADLPSNATIRTAFLRFNSSPTIEGDPFTALGCLQIELVEMSQPLDNTAYDTLGFFISCELNSPTSIDVAFDVEDALVQGQSQLYLRLGFETESNGDAVADLYTVRTAPILEVTYLLP
ncbi:internalin, putative [hydrothermal vent metagenome]|uniref:Internalin, putative n=1 Tax=hydrothermal vent metagenome TaxID=652676 RepID=A0A3B0VEP5_9ZZZZ